VCRKSFYDSLKLLQYCEYCDSLHTIQYARAAAPPLLAAFGERRKRRMPISDGGGMNCVTEIPRP